MSSNPEPEPEGAQKSHSSQLAPSRSTSHPPNDFRNDPTYRLSLRVPREVNMAGRRFAREDFHAWLWQEFEAEGLLGIHEGTLLSDEAVEKGLETESWTIDSGQAPRERDWVSQQDSENVELYFASESGAKHARHELLEKNEASLEIIGIEVQEPQDWDAEWKASFKGIKVPPFWHVVPRWEQAEEGRIPIVVNPGAGFGTGTHETTQLCLQALGELGQDSLIEKQVLDFGSGSGILSIASALLGSPYVFGVEIDPLANENAAENAALNQVSSKIEFSEKISESMPECFDVVVANILKPVLLEQAETLVSHLEETGVLILSGLVEADVKPVSEAYAKLLGGRKPDVRALNEWRALVWR